MLTKRENEFSYIQEIKTMRVEQGTLNESVTTDMATRASLRKILVITFLLQ